MLSVDVSALAAVAAKLFVIPAASIMAAAATTSGTAASAVTHQAVTNPGVTACCIVRPIEVTDPNDELLQLMAKMDRGEMGMVQVADCLEAALNKRGYVYVMDIGPRMVGFDPVNRDGEGGNTQQVLKLAEDIWEVGFSWEATRHATCVEVIPGTRDVEIFNQKFSDGNGMAAVPVNSIHFGSLSGGHTNYVLRCIAGGVPTTRADMADKGHFSVDLIRRKDPLYADAVSKGLTWRVLKWEVRTMWPRALQIIQAARNLPAAMNRRVSEMQGMSQLHSLSAAACERGDRPNWPDIKRAVLLSKPAWAEYVDELILFVAAKAGGPKGTFLDGMKRFFRQWVETGVRSSLPGGLYAQLADLPWTFTALAIWVTAYTCPKEHVKAGGHCSWVTVTEVKMLAWPDMKAKCILAEDCLMEARSRLVAATSQEIFESNEATKALTKLDIAIGRFLLNKQDSSKVKFKTVAECGQQFLKDLAQLLPAANLKVFDGLWPIDPVATVQSGHMPNAEDIHAIGLVPLDATTGKVTGGRALMRAGGFDIGATVAPKPTPPAATGPTIYKILNITEEEGGDFVSLEKLPTGTAAMPVSVTVAEFLQLWLRADAREMVELHPGWPKCRSSQIALGRSLRAKGSIFTALGCLSERMDEITDVEGQVAVHVKPMRRVIAVGNKAVAELHLVPETTNVKAISDEDYAATSPEDAANMIEVTLEPKCEGYRFFLVGVTGAENMAPVWCVRTTQTSEEATCIWTDVRIQMLIGLDFVETEYQPVLKKRRLVTKATAKKPVEDTVLDVSVTIPVLINTVPIQCGGELLLFKAKALPRPRALQPITLQALTKNLRQAKASAAAAASSKVASANTF